MEAKTYLVRYTPLGVTSIDKPEPTTILGKVGEALLKLNGWGRCTAADIDAGPLRVYGPAGEELRRSKVSGEGISALQQDLPPANADKYTGAGRR